jgi:hypothetical protein
MRAKSIAPLRKCGPGTSTMQGQTATRSARLAQQSSDLAIAIATVLPGQLDDIGREPFLIAPTARDFALR